MLHRAVFFYVDDGLVALMDLVWFQEAFDTLTGFFDRVGIWKNSGKTVGILCHPCRAVGKKLETAY